MNFGRLYRDFFLPCPACEKSDARVACLHVMKWQDRLWLQVLGGPAWFTQVLGGTAVEADSCLLGLCVSRSFFVVTVGQS